MAFKLDNIKQKETPLKESGKVNILQKEITLFNKAFSSKIKEDFYTELSVLLKAGVNLKEALELIEHSQKKQQNKDLLNSVSKTLVSGQSLSEAIKKQKPFTEYEYYSIKIGEETGTLGQVTEQLGDFYARKNEQRRHLTNALTYPIIILTTAILVVIFMLQYVVPMFQDIFEQQKVELPLITKFIIRVSEFTKAKGFLILICLVLLIVLYKVLFKNNKKLKRIKDNLVLRLPFVGHFVKNIYLSQFTQAVSLLTSSKIPVINSIQLVKQMISFYPLQDALETVEQEILKGKQLSSSLNQHKLFDKKMIALVKVSEETNQTEFIFNRLNKQYNTQVEQQSKMLSTIIEPFLILIVGVLVGIILIAMYLPMFKLSSVLG